MVTIEQLQKHINKIPANNYLNLLIEEISEGTCQVRMPYNSIFTDSEGNTHDGALMTLSDIAGWVALATIHGLDRQFTFTVDLKASFLGSSKFHGDLLADAKIISDGRDLTFGDVIIRDQDGIIICHSTMTYIRSE